MYLIKQRQKQVSRLSPPLLFGCKETKIWKNRETNSVQGIEKTDQRQASTDIWTVFTLLPFYF